MKIAIMNFSGNVGKSTIAAHLLTPRISNAKIFAVESTNTGVSQDGVAAEKLRGEKFGSLIDKIMLLDSAIIDVGASNAEKFLLQMQQYDGSHEEFDTFIVPAIKERKVQADTVNTVKALQAIGIPSGKIKLLFNKLEPHEEVVDEFIPLFGLSATGACIADKRCCIYYNEVYEKIKFMGKSLGDISLDATDWRQKLREATTDEEREEFTKMVAIKRLAVTANMNLDKVFKALLD